MSADYTTVGLIANAKRRGFFPAGAGLTTSEILQVLTEQLRNYIPAFLKGIREEYLVASLAISVTSAVVPIPARACGVALRTIGWQTADGRVVPLTRTEPERVSGYGLTGSQPCAYIFQGNSVVLVPAVTSGTLVVKYQQRPGELVLPTSCAEIDGLDDAQGFTVLSIPTSIVAGSLCDIVGAAPNFKLKAMDLVVATASSGVISFTSEVPTDWASGDFVCLATETCIPQIPLECFDLLAQAAAVELAQATGSERLPTIKSGLKDLREQVSLILSPRSDGSARRVVSRSRLGRRGW